MRGLLIRAANRLPGDLSPPLVLTLALVAGLMLRVVGLAFPVTYGPDQEQSVARALLHLGGDLNPHFFNYPSFHAYSLAGVFWIFVRTTAAPVPSDVSPILTNNLSLSDPTTSLLRPYYVIGRGVTVAYAVGTVVLVYLMGRQLYGRGVGALGALFLALTPLHVWDSHYATVDVPAAFWVAFAGCAAALALKEPRFRWYCLSGMAAGLAAGTKYPAGVALVMPLAAQALVMLPTYRATGKTPVISRRAKLVVITGGVMLTTIAFLAWVFRAALVSLLVSFSSSDVLPPVAALIVEWGPLVLAFGALLVVLSTWCAQRKRSGFTAVFVTLFVRRATLLTVGAALIAFVAVVPYAILDPRAFVNGLYSEIVHSSTGHYGFDTRPHGLIYTRGLYFLLAGFPFAMGLPLYLAAIGGFAAAWHKRKSADWLMTTFVLTYYAVSGLGRVVFLRYMIPLLPFLALLAARLLYVCLAEGRVLRRVGTALVLAIAVPYTAWFSCSTTLRYAHDARTDAAQALPHMFPEGTTIAVTAFPNYYPHIDEAWFRVIDCAEGTHDALALVNCGADVVILSGTLFWRPYRDTETFAAQYTGYEALRADKLGYKRIAVFRQGYLNRGFYTSLDPMYDGYFVSPSIEIFQSAQHP